MAKALIFSPSILAGNHASLKDSLKQIESTPTVEWVHLDIMDGHFVPNLTFGPETVAQLRPDSQLFFDTHLMLDNPHLYVEAFAKAGSQNITIHVEPDYPIKATLARIRQLGCQCGISLNPDTPVEEIKPFLAHVDLVLVMTVHPGFGGQAFREDVLTKIEQIVNWRDAKNLDYRIEVDGGVDLHTAELCKQHGADTLVAGSAFFKAKDRELFAKAMLEPCSRVSSS